ncbi:Meiosis protein mei2 [Penicillium subrubescens]|uniref:Meiosis protein mei2 n=1 Tax=Penicillium subrubescens TaxID=1316194 RepID=A0A1Q5TEB7_9EURO|nr:Meiosis protein mei2 [Penicillium subrubescens]
MSDNHPEGIPPIPGLGSQGYSMPPATPRPRPAVWPSRVFPVIPLVPIPSARTKDDSTSERPSTPAPVDDDLSAGVSCRLNERTQGVSISETQSTPVPSVDEFFDKTFPHRNERTQGVRISENQATPALLDDDWLARAFPRHYEYPWTQRQPTAAELWQQQSSRAEVDDNPYSLAHVPRRDTQSQYLATPVPATPMNRNLGVRQMAAATPVPTTPMNFNLGVRQIAAYDPAGSVFDEASIHQPRLLAEGFIPAGQIRPPPGLTHPDMAHPSDSPLTVRPSHPSPGHVRSTPQVHSQSLLPYSPPTPRTVPRRFRVANIDTDTDPMLALQIAQHFKSAIGPFVTELNTKGHFYIGFDDLNDALKWMDMIQRAQIGWHVYPLSVDEFNDATRLPFPISADLDDVVIVTAWCGPQSPVKVSNVVDHVLPFLQLVGVVYSAVVLPGQEDYPLMVRYYEVEVRYRQIQSALNAIRALNGIRDAVLVLEVMPPVAGSHFATTSKARHDYEAGMKGSWRGSVRRTPKTPAKTPGRRGTNSGRPPVTPRTPVSGRDDQEHAIDLNKIACGTDGRTAIMCRNIPNKMTWREFKSVLDMSSAGRYDYVYLRIDFGANQNVGYAFVNFATPADIATFVRARAGRTWPGFERFTGKIAEASYADVQGLSTLIERFRNSPVILNHPDNRPRLFHTSGPKTGAEAFFPLVSNFYTLSMGVFRSQVDAGLRGAETPTATRRAGRPRLPPPAEDYPTNN